MARYSFTPEKSESSGWGPKSEGFKKTTRMVGGLLLAALLWIGLKALWQIPAVQDLFLLKYLPRLGHDADFGVLLLLGALTSFHCLGMCGGIAISQTLREQSTVKGKGLSVWLLPSLLYNAGRVLAYTTVGGIAGGLGQAINLTGIWKGVIPLCGGLFMIVMGINLLGIFPVFRRLVPRMPYFAAKKIQGTNHYGPFFIGLLSGLMPCGPLQIAQLYALGTGNAIYGALSMLAFSVGTVPLLLSFGAISTLISKKHTGLILKISAGLVIVLGLVMVGRGLALAGVVSSQPERIFDAGTSVAVSDGKVQRVSTALQSDRFPAIVVQKGIPVKWIIKADASQLNGCNNALTIPKYQINKSLTVGANEIQFTPRETGEIVYTCWMGMIKSKITVVADLTKVGLQSGK